MTDTDHPQPPAPVADHVSALTGYLEQLHAVAASSDTAAAGLADDLRTAALGDLRALATACGVDWDGVLAERDRRSVVAE
ncbi:hypothetical protein [Kineococcus rhizosphaerae]|uniref:Uncharacterized protein n=1 Tax=Kineococcus rhizosphaerae TaxID=559628 RepID=A0A2T0QYV3_9ACTN|nr:hypothetical protein [Kineococcus rhizosphaerae]PRY11551.1 hypothetical protein CLV37_113175 [Kineococcus rhizosphaerae]